MEQESARWQDKFNKLEVIRNQELDDMKKSLNQIKQAQKMQFNDDKSSLAQITAYENNM